jgi:hypothetical protein
MGLEAINDADATSNSGQRNPYLKPGNYVVEIVNIRFFTTRYKGDAALVTLRPVTSSNPEVELGVMHTWYCGFNNDLGPINFKRFLGAAYGLDPTDEATNARITADVAKEACGKTQPLSGQVVGVSCHNTTTEKGEEFTVHTWRPITDEEFAELQAQLAG